MNNKLSSNAGKLVLFVLILMGIAVFYVTCRSTPEAKLRIGVILSLTDKTDFIGKPERDILFALEKEYQANPQVAPEFVLDIRDSQGKPDIAMNLFRGFAKNPEVVAVIGPSTSGESIAVAAEAEKAGVPLLSLAASKQILVNKEDTSKNYRWVFKFAQNDDLAAQLLLTTIQSQHENSVGILYSNDAFGKSGGEVFKKAIQNTSIQLRYQYMFQSDITVAQPIIRAIPRNLDALVIWGTAPGPQLLVGAAKTLKLGCQIYLSHGNASEEFIANAGDACEGAIIVGSRDLTEETYLAKDLTKDEVLRNFRQYWSKNLGGTPSHFGGHARDAFEALMLAMTSGKFKQSTPDKYREVVRDYMERDLGRFEGVTGTFRFKAEDHAGLDLSAFQVYRIRNQRFVPLEFAK